MQRHYEIVLLIHPSRSEQVPAMLSRYREIIGNGAGAVHRVEDWGRRRLAYMINEVHKAHYVMMNIECNLETLRELERNFKFNDSVVRSLVIRRNRAITEESALAKAKAAEEQAEAERAAAQAARDAQAAAEAAEAASRDDAPDDADDADDTKSDDDATPESATETETEPETQKEPV